MKIVIISIALLMLLLTILYTTLYVVHSAKEDGENGNLTAPKPEKLISKRQFTVEKQVIETISARPFMNELRGEQPSGFSSSFLETTVPSYPYNHQPPNNINDIIEYLTDNAHKQKELLYQQQQQQQQQQYNAPTKNNNYYPQDPFFAFKPQNPSDINLLAPNSFRFAPVIVHNRNQKKRQSLKEAESVVTNASSPFLRKPLKLTLNIYPTPFFNSFENEQGGFQGPGVTPRYRYPYMAQWTRSGYHSGGMVVHLNVYPGMNGHYRSTPEPHQQFN